MAGKVLDKTKNMINSIGAMQTLAENFPMKFISLGDLKFATSFDVLSILFKILGIQREELIEKISDFLCGDMTEDTEGSGFIAQAEEIVKIALEANILNILNCTTNPIISNDLLDYYEELNISKSGEGITLDVSEIDFTGVLQRNPFDKNDKKFYFDVDKDSDGNDYTPNTLYKSKDFNAFLWYIINKSNKSQKEETVWDNRYRSALYGKKKKKHKEIIRCTYIDDEYPNNDKIKVHLCGARGDNFVEPANYFKTRELKVGSKKWALNKTIFEFNHEFLSSIKLYEPKVLVAEIVEYFMGKGNFTVNLGFSINEEIIQGKIQQIIKDVISMDDTEINDCFYSFSNDEYNTMIEQSEKNRYNIINNNNENIEITPSNILDNLNEINTNSTLNENKTIISNTLTNLTVNPAQDPSGEISFNISYDWQFELLRMLAYPFIRPLFTPKVIFLLLVNKKIMGSIEDIKTVTWNTIVEDLTNGLFFIIKDIIIQLKDMLVEMLMDYVLEKLTPLLELIASKLLLESLQLYKDLLIELINNCALGWNNSNPLIGTIDDVNYADIVPTQVEPEQSIC